MLLLVRRSHHYGDHFWCEYHTATVVTQTARYPTDIWPRKHPGKLASLQRSHHSSDHSDTLPKVKGEHHSFFVAQILTFPSAVPLHIPGPTACMPSEAGRSHALICCPSTLPDVLLSSGTADSLQQYQGPRHPQHMRQRALCSRHHTQWPLFIGI